MKKSKGLFMMLVLTLLIVSCGQQTAKVSDGSSMESGLPQIASGASMDVGSLKNIIRLNIHPCFWLK